MKPLGKDISPATNQLEHVNAPEVALVLASKGF